MENNIKEDSLKTMLVLFKAHQTIEDYAKKDIVRHGLTLNEFAAIEALYHKGVLPVQGMCSEVLIANSSMTYVLDKLELKGLIKRIQDEKDKRTFHVDLSLEGKNFADAIIPEHYSKMRVIFNHLTEEERMLLNGLLKKLGYFAKTLEV